MMFENGSTFLESELKYRTERLTRPRKTRRRRPPRLHPVYTRRAHPEA